MKRFLIITEVYSRGMSEDPPTYEFVKARSLEALVRKRYAHKIVLGEKWSRTRDELEQSNGDGDDLVTIVDLVEEKVVFGPHKQGASA